MKKLFTILAAVCFAGSMMAATATMQYKGTTTTNMAADANNAATVGLDADLFNVVSDKGSASNHIGLNKAGTIRFYAHKDSGNGNILTVTILDGTIDAITLDVAQTATFEVKAGENVVTATEGTTYAIGATSFVIQNKTQGASTQLHLNKIDITYTSSTSTPEQPTVTYTVAGSSEAAFGTTWSCDNAANDMTLQADGTYKWEKAGIELLAGSLDFKVCKDHSWDVAYPGSDYKLTIPATGIYTVTITFNPTTEEVNATATKTADVVIIPTIAMHGNFAGPSNWADTENFTIAADEKTATLVMNLEARSDYEFGMRIGGKGDWTANGVAFTRENASAVVVSGSGSLTLVADVAGEYTFTWTYETNTLAITFPAKEEPKPATWDEIVFTEVAAKGSLNGAIFTSATNAAFTLTVTDTDASKVEVDANTASFGTAEENATYTFRLKTGGKSSSKNGLTLAIPADGKLRIAARPGSKDATDRTIVLKQGDVELYNKVVLEEKVDNYYSYVLVEVKQGTVTIEYPVNSLYLYAFGFQAVAGPTVGFENIEATEKAVKFIENGQIFILRDGAVFNLMGARVK